MDKSKTISDQMDINKLSEKDIKNFTKSLNKDTKTILENTKKIVENRAEMLLAVKVQTQI